MTLNEPVRQLAVDLSLASAQELNDLEIYLDAMASMKTTPAPEARVLMRLRKVVTAMVTEHNESTALHDE